MKKILDAQMILARHTAALVALADVAGDVVSLIESDDPKLRALAARQLKRAVEAVRRAEGE